MTDMTRTQFVMYVVDDGAIVSAEDRKTGEDYDMVQFTTAQTDEESGTIHELQFNAAAWQDMGEPHALTLTIEPGDKLNV